MQKASTILFMTISLLPVGALAQAAQPVASVSDNVQPARKQPSSAVRPAPFVGAVATAAPTAGSLGSPLPAYCGERGPKKCASGLLGGENGAFSNSIGPGAFETESPTLKSRLQQAVAPASVLRIWVLWLGPPATQVAITTLGDSSQAIAAFRLQDGKPIETLVIPASVQESIVQESDALMIEPTDLLDDGGRQLAIVTQSLGNAGGDSSFEVHQLRDRGFVEIFSASSHVDMGGIWSPSVLLGKQVINVGKGRRAKHYVWDGAKFSVATKTGRGQ